MKDCLGFGVNFVLERIWYKHPRTKIDGGEDGGRRINGDAGRKETTPLGGDSKISEEDPTL